MKLVWGYNINTHTNCARGFISVDGISSSGYCTRKYWQNTYSLEAPTPKILILWQLKKRVPRPEGLASVTSSMPGDPMILSCVICTDPWCPAPLTSSAVKPTDWQAASTSLVETEETPKNVERGYDVCEPTAERDMQLEYSSWLVVGPKCRSRAHGSCKFCWFKEHSRLCTEIHYPEVHKF